MNNSLLKRTLVASAVIAGTGGSCSALASTANTEAMEVMVIESTKRDVSLKEVDNAISVVTAEELEKANVTQVQDLGKVFAGLVIESRGSRIFPSVTLRGINSNDYYNMPLTVYVDGIPQDSTFLTQPLVNVEQVELLRGPQGTLYGSNAQAGVINIVTKKVVDQPQLSSSVSYSNLNKQLELSGAAEIGESSYADITLKGAREEGTIDYVGSGNNESDFDESDEFSGLARFHYLPDNSAISSTFSLAADQLDSQEEVYLTEAQYKAGETSTVIPDLQRDVYTYALNVGYDLGESQITSVTAIQTRDIEREFFGYDSVEDQKTFSQELRLTTQYGDNLDAVLGAYLESKHYDGEAYSGTNKIQTDTYALFGEAVYGITESLDLTFGLRASYLEASSDFSGNMYVSSSYDQSLTDSAIIPKVAIGWQVTPDTRLYSSLSSGYRPAGYNHVPTSSEAYEGYDAETSTNAELGWRTALLDNQLLISGAIYWIETEDTQAYVGDTIGQLSLFNVGDSLSKGIELELTYFATDDLTINLGATAGKSTFEDGTGDYEGNSLAYAPEGTANLGFEYFLPQALVDGDVSIQTNARYTSKTYFDVDNTLSQSDYIVTDLSFNYDYSETFSARLFLNNITDETYTTYGFSMMGTNYYQYGDGSEIGLTLNWEL
ncbi:TonB-dependent receptor [Vibrio sp. JC009]|uniref:TonB-dependent receptor n=1 Tax=Vibrio sp. JC009 TaxID=2912314 RepID=UPI0023B0414A|nr:TonB-dependent receptor [Vibrio sp. JC009]WED23347.1 TonB-dependent receptor [Vibrio sp. JC009]